MARLLTSVFLLVWLGGCLAHQPGGRGPRLTIGSDSFVPAQLATVDDVAVPAAEQDAWFLDRQTHGGEGASNQHPWPEQVRWLEPDAALDDRSGQELVTDARTAALNEPVRDGFIGATVVYPYIQGRVYKVHTAPRTHTTIELEPGEEIQELIAGDTVSWVFSDTVGGIGTTAHPLVFVKPIQSGLQTNLTIVTTHRLYQLDLESNPSGQYTTQVSWRYPQQERAQAGQQSRRYLTKDRSQGTKVSLGGIAFDYAIEIVEGREPAWLPEHAFHDGAKTFIKFPAHVTTRPPLFVVRRGNTEIVNYRAQGDFYVVDTVLGSAELRLGEDRQTVVRLTRRDA